MAVSLPDFKDRIGTARQELNDHLEKNYKDIPQLYAQMSDEERRAGKLVGKLLQTGFGNQQVDDAFSWWEVEHNEGNKLDYIKKNILLIEAIGVLAQASGEHGYRALRKIFVTLNQK